MDTNRRDLIKVITGASAMMAGIAARAKAAPVEEASPDAPLIAAGLDPWVAYRRMFASTDKDEGCYWLYAGLFPVQVDEVGPVYFMQEQSLNATKTADIGPDSYRIDQRLAGTFRNMQTGNVIDTIHDPITGETAKRKGTTRFNPTRLTVSRNGKGAAFSMVFPTVPVLGVTTNAQIKGDRVSFVINTEYTYGPASSQGQISTLKIYSSLADLKSGAPSVASQGFYSDRDRNTGKIVVSGVMQKAKPDEKLDPLAWDRVRGFFPDFFDGDRIAMNWK